MYVSNENATLVDVYFSLSRLCGNDVVMTHTKSNVIQYNEYYPFGLQTSNSWTRENTTGNNFLYNEGGEFNTTTALYDLPFRNYDATLGRFFQVDPLAHWDASTSPFTYAANNPVLFNDPLGLVVDVTGYSDYQLRALYRANRGNYGNFGDWAQDNLDFSGAGGADRIVGDGNGNFFGVNAKGEFGQYKYYENSYQYADGVEAQWMGTYVKREWVPYEKETQGGQPCPPGIDCAAIAKLANEGLQWAGYGEAGLASIQIGLVNHRNSLSISSKVGTFGKFSTRYLTLGYAAKVLGPGATYVGAPLSIGLDYVDPVVSTPRFVYRTTGTLSSVLGGMAIGAEFGGPYGALGGAGISLIFMGGEMAYDGLVWFGNELSRGIVQTENALKNRWYPGK